MNTFKKGDKILRINRDCCDVKVGKIYTFDAYSNYSDAMLSIVEDDMRQYMSIYFVLVTPFAMVLYGKRNETKNNV